MTDAELQALPRAQLLELYRDGPKELRPAVLAELTRRGRGDIQVAQARPWRPFAHRRPPATDNRARAAGDK